MKSNSIHAFAVILVLFLSIQNTFQITLNEFLTLTFDQKLKLDTFREIITPQLPDSASYDYMRRDIFLIRWLRDEYFNVARAEKRLLDHVQWRKENAIDNIFQEDWEDYDREFRVMVEGCDRDHKPVLSVFAGDWDVRKQIVSGKFNKMKRYMEKLFEEAQVTITKMQESGQNATQATMIFELKNFNLVNQACPRCIPIYLYALSLYQKHYPGLCHKLMWVNTPNIALSLYDIYKQVLTPQTREVLAIYGHDKRHWQKNLLKEIERDQLTKQFGGINEEAIDYSEFRLTGDVYRCNNI